MSKEDAKYINEREVFYIKGLIRRLAIQLYPVCLENKIVIKREQIETCRFWLKSHLQNMLAVAALPASCKLCVKDYQHLFHSMGQIYEYYEGFKENLDEAEAEIQWLENLLRSSLLESIYFFGNMGYRQYYHNKEGVRYLALDIHQINWERQNRIDTFGISIGNRQPQWAEISACRRGINLYFDWNYKKRKPKPMVLNLYLKEGGKEQIYECLIFDVNESSYGEFKAEFGTNNVGKEGELKGAYRLLGQREYHREKMLKKNWKDRKRFLYRHILMEELASILIHDLLFSGEISAAVDIAIKVI